MIDKKYSLIEASGNVEAAGKNLSLQNATKLTNAFRAIASVLINAGLSDAQSLTQLMEDSIEDIEGVGTAVDAGTPVAAERFASQVHRVTWHDRFKSSIKIFSRRFSDAHNLTDQEYQQEYGEEETRPQAISSIIGELSTILAELSRSHPGPAENMRDRYNGYESPYSPFMLSAESGESTPVNKVTLAFQCEAAAETVPTTAKRGRKASKNRSPITGVLFRVDEPSEAVPAVGPGMPLYVPQSVAASIVNTVAGLPLDAHDNLSEHATEAIAGVMLSAELQGNDFVVHGYLWPASKGSQVRNIVANQERLGMSMTAEAWGHEAEVDGQKVFWVDDIELNGANILFSDCATYQKTRLIVAEKQEPGSRDPTAIAASDASSNVSDNPNPTKEPVMEEIQKQIAALTATVQSALEKLDTNYSALSAAVSEIQAARQSEQAVITAASTQEVERLKVATLVDAVTASVQASTQAAINLAMNKFVNPSRQPQRLTTPLLAGGAQQSATGSTEVMSLQLAIARIEGEMQVTSGMADQIRLTDERRALEQRLSQVPLA